MKYLLGIAFGLIVSWAFGMFIHIYQREPTICPCNPESVLSIGREAEQKFDTHIKRAYDYVTLHDIVNATKEADSAKLYFMQTEIIDQILLDIRKNLKP